MLRDISLHLMDLIQNSVTAGASLIEVFLQADRIRDLLTVSIQDNGCGMTEEFVKKVTDPFTTSRKTRKVGMGIPFFQLACEQAGGKMEIRSEPGVGTWISGTFCISHIDRLPLGEVGETARYLILCYPGIDFRFTLQGEETFYLDTRELKRELDGVPITDYDILQWIKEYLEEGVSNIFGGVLHEVVRRIASD